MDFNTLAELFLDCVEEEGVLSGDLAADEHAIRAFAHRLGAKSLEKRLERQRPGYEGSSRICPQCRAPQRFVNHRSKQLLTILGPIRIRRAYYRCDHCGHSSLPWDEQVGLGRRACSPALARMATACAADMPYAKAIEKLNELADVRIGRSTLHELTQQVGTHAQAMEQVHAAESFALEAEPERLYAAVDGLYVRLDGQWQEVKAATCYWEDAPGEYVARYRARHDPVEDFVSPAESLLRRCGQHRADEHVLLGDGAPWIWHRIGAIMPPSTVHITDWYHVMEHVWACGHALHGESTQAAWAWVKPIETMLWHGQLKRLYHHLDAQREAAPSKEERQAIEALSTYLRNQGDRLVYDDFRAAGYDIGSGRVESACGHVVEQRAKGSGMQWTHRGFQNVMSLRCVRLNEQDDELWNRQPLRNAA